MPVRVMVMVHGVQAQARHGATATVQGYGPSRMDGPASWSTGYGWGYGVRFAVQAEYRVSIVDCALPVVACT